MRADTVSNNLLHELRVRETIDAIKLTFCPVDQRVNVLHGRCIALLNLQLQSQHAPVLYLDLIGVCQCLAHFAAMQGKSCLFAQFGQQVTTALQSRQGVAGYSLTVCQVEAMRPAATANT